MIGSANIRWASQTPRIAPKFAPGRRPSLRPPRPSPRGENQRNGRIEMGAGNRAKDQDQHDQHRAGRDGISQKAMAWLPPDSRSAMMPEPTTVASSKTVPRNFGERPSAPTSGVMRRSCRYPASCFAATCGPAPRFSDWRRRRCDCSACDRCRRKRARFPLRVPSTAAGSGMPQCAVMGWPGQAGQTSPAASSQTVMTKSSFGASGRANSSQDFERNPPVSIIQPVQQRDGMRD